VSIRRSAQEPVPRFAYRIVLLERHGTRPMVVDIDTGLATELPWTSESAVSWQRVPAP
jgi:hypothetical protein